jgi:hypothetical protein
MRRAVARLKMRFFTPFTPFSPLSPGALGLMPSFRLARLPAALSLSLLACAPQTQYRRSAYVPAVRPIPFDGRIASPGTLRIEGTATGTGVSENLAPQVGDSALLVPKVTLEGSAMVAVTPHAEFGLRASYADYAWRQASALGTMPVPSETASTGYGLEVHVALPLSKDGKVSVGFAGNVMLYHVPYAEWQLTGVGSSPPTPDCVPSTTCVSGYTLHDTRADDPLVYSLGLYPSYAFGDHGELGHIVGVIAATSGFKNNGFSDQPANGSTLDSVGPIWTLGAGYGFSRDWGRLSGLLYRPITDGSSPVDYGFGVEITLGINVELWSSKEKQGE